MDNSIIQKLNEYQPLIRKVSLMYAQNETEADDMFQEICIQVWYSYPQFKGDSKFSTWLYRIAINTAISWIRKEKKHKLNDFEQTKLLGALDDDSFYEKEEKKEQIKTMYNAIKQLSEVDRTLTMLYLDDVAYAEISEITGLSIGNIKVKMNRIKKRLRKLIENHG